MSTPTGRPLAQGDVLWTPPADARERFVIGRYLGWLERERGLSFDGVRRALAVVGLRSRGLLVVGLGVLRGPFARAVRARARLAGDAGGRVVPRSAPELRRAHGRPRRGSRCERGRRVLPVASDARAHVRRPPRAGRARPRRPTTPGGRPRGQGRRLPPEHPRDARRLPREREPRRDLGHVPARVRRPQRPRPPRPTRAEGAPGRRRVSVRRQARRPARADRGGAGAAAEPGGRRARPLPRRGRRRASRRGLLGRPPRRAGRARVRPAALRPPALRALLLRHHRVAEGHRPLPRRHPARAPEEPRLQLGPPAGRPPPVVHDDRLDDVERPRLRAPPPRVDRDDRRQSRLPRHRVPVARDRGDAADVLRAQPGVHDGVPQGGPRARTALRPLLRPHGLRGGLAASPRGLRVALRAVRAGGQRQRRQRRDRRVHGHRPGDPAGSRLRRARCRRGCSAPTSTPSDRTGRPSSASSASS